ncbi:nesprin-2 isoform X2 [Toxotes jaculatrix]|uniref:nesprin-2 isoform X2 n=1 Tax=Toxotes jaculatrix TaxID=941984 RepID=UPI001B3B0902|nr:nesprin-2 isoform X2 [Toxotes jaculatrix]
MSGGAGSECRAHVVPAAGGSEVSPGEEVEDMELFLNLSESPLELSGEDTKRVDGDLQGCGQLETRWVLWREFMEEHAHLDIWLRLAEQAVGSPNSTCVTYATAKEELRKFERLRREAGSRLVRLDGLTRRNQTLTLLFLGAARARLLASARECGRRWDDVNAKLESIIARLKLFVSEWEGFEAQREELALWLADLDVRLTEVDHLDGNTCEKLRHLQVFEEDWTLSQATDSGCPSETLLEDEGALDKAYLDLPAVSNRPKDFSQSANSTQAFTSHLPSLVHRPPSPSSPTHEHLGLEWDPSVDIGRSVSCDDGDSSYFSACAGLCHRDDLNRWSCLRPLSSQTDISSDITNQEVGWEKRLDGDRRGTSTPDRQDFDTVSFDGGRVRAWLGVQIPAPPERTTSCSKAVQTDREAEEEPSCCEDAERPLSGQSVTSSGASSSSSPCSPALLCLLLAAALALLACLIWVVPESACHCSSGMPRNFHLTLRYVNGPPPT